MFEPESDVPVIGDWPQMTRLVLSKAATRLVVAFLVLGVAGLATDAAIVRRVSKDGLGGENRGQIVRGAHNDLGGALTRFNADARACAGDTQLSCLHAADEEFASAFDGFVAKVAKVWSSPAFDVSDVVARARACATALRARATAPDAAAYDAAASSIAAALLAFDRAYVELSAPHPSG